MSEREIVKAIKENLRRQDDGWRLIMGRDVLTAREVIRRLDRDGAFRKRLVRMVVELSVDILTRKPEGL